MKRVMIVGGPGSGKSTLGRLLGERTGLPVFHMDHIHWMSGWVERDRDEKDRLTHEVHARDTWIFEGGYSRTYGERVTRADTFVWLDIPLWLRLWRVLRRSVVGYGKTRPDLPEGCPEKLDRETLDFIAFIWRTRHSARAKLQAIADDPPIHLTIHHLRNLRDVRLFLGSVETDRPTPDTSKTETTIQTPH
ncbi:MAG: DNA topology modulation protein FlaR [Inquilinaceae bacterium]